jgi:hypothetical protein
MAEVAEDPAATRRRAVASDYRKKMLNCRELEARVKTGTVRPISRAVGSLGGGSDAFLALEDLGFVHWVRVVGFWFPRFECGGAV